MKNSLTSCLLRVARVTALLCHPVIFSGDELGDIAALFSDLEMMRKQLNEIGPQARFGSQETQ